MWRQCLLVSAVVLAGCSSYAPEYTETEVESSGFYPNLDWVFNRDREQKLETLAHENFSVIVARVQDKRPPKAYLKATQSEGLIYEYNPDELLMSAPAYVQNQLQKYLNFGRNKEHVYVAEVELTDARMRIMKGDFINGKWGRYVVDLEANILVRDENRLVLQPTPIRIRHERRRVDDGGRQPSAAQDRARIMLALEEAFEPLAIDLAWQIRRGHLRLQGGNLAEN